MAVPAFDEMMFPLLSVIPSNGALEKKDAVKRIEDFFKLTPVDVSEKLSSGQTKLYNRVSWAVWYLNQAKLIETAGARGTYRLTTKGKDLLHRPTAEIKEKLEECVKNISRTSGRQTKLQSKSPEEEANKTPEEQIMNAFSVYQKRLVDDVLNQLKSEDTSPEMFEKIVLELMEKMGYGVGQSTPAFSVYQKRLVDDVLNQLKSEDTSPEMFEKIVLELMEKMGYGVGQSTPKTHDGGIDGKINEDVLGLGKIYLQAKRWTTANVTEKEMRDFIGAVTVAKVSKAVFITTSDFNKKAQEVAEAYPHGTVRLINGTELASLMIEYGLGVQPGVSIELKKLDKDYFSTDED